ncbi:hypothetical protein ABIB58_002868 [Brevundimonas sp. UYEF29]|uniref:hypothetical protein n=1 Tax=Brevundimonas sp. UYEF29 TaxID=3156346 RepID=UPI00339379AA
MAVRYAWKPGSRVRLDPEKAGKEMEDVRRRNGGALTPEALLERARSANSAVHDHFEWDDGKAAHLHRISQAGDLIRAITIDVTHSNVEPPKTIRAFVSVEREGQRSYTSTVHALSDADLRRQVVAKAWADLEAWRERHRELTEFARIFSAMDDTKVA